jgi:NIPSNAP
MTRVVEIRTYRLKPGTKASFHRLVLTQSLPVLRRFGTDVVAFGPSTSEEDSYFLIRAYASAADLVQQQGVFYARPEWTEGPRQAILDLIEEHVSVVCAADEPLINALRRLVTGFESFRPPP